MPKVITIGVYGFTEEDFFQSLKTANVDLLCDIRWRRGVRGSKYAFANHKRLVARLEEMGIDYLHRRDLAPTPEIRQHQKDVDKETKVAKRKRDTLNPAFISAFEEEILADFDAQEFLKELAEDKKVIALLCVEKLPSACHRSLVAEKLKKEVSIDITHLTSENQFPDDLIVKL